MAGVDSGWIKLHRAMLDGPIIQHAGMLQVWIYCLLRANWEPRRIMVQGSLTPIQIERGEFVTGRTSLHAALYPDKHEDNPVASTVWRWLEALERMECLKLQAVRNRCSIVTICNYNTYQARDDEPCATDAQPVNNQCATDAQPVRTNKNKTIQESNLSLSEAEQTRNARIPMPEDVPFQNAAIHGIETPNGLLMYVPGDERWTMAFVRWWNSLPGVHIFPLDDLDDEMKVQLSHRLNESKWFWKRTEGLFPLHYPDDRKMGIAKFLERGTVGKILAKTYAATGEKTSPKKNTEPVKPRMPSFEEIKRRGWNPTTGLGPE